jgi:outer membrane lipoprotein LolB
MPALQQASQWALDGRAAASIGKQGWQASLAWKQQDSTSELHLTGPLGIGASVVRLSPEGLSIDGAKPREEAAAILHERLGVDLPLGSLRFWLLGVPDPAEDSTVTRNAQDRAQQWSQSGWTVVIDRYMPVRGDWLPAQLSVVRDDVRVRIAVDSWDFPR